MTFYIFYKVYVYNFASINFKKFIKLNIKHSFANKLLIQLLHPSGLMYAGQEQILNSFHVKIYQKINAYKNDSFENLKTIVKDLKLYQKVTMHPMSHGTVGLTPFTTNEIKESINLLYKFEKNLKNLVDNDIITI